MTKLEHGKLSKFRPATVNANKHNPRGLKLLSKAMGEIGYVAPITVAADGEALDGSARLETAFDQFGDEAIVIRHDGRKPVVMVREDIPNAHTPEAKRIAVEANRIAQIDLTFDIEVLDSLRTEIDLSDLWRPEEWAELLEAAGSEIANSESTSPEGFKEYDEGIETEHCCPKCGYKWSGSSN